MPNLSLTDFVDVVLKSGSSKASKIKQVKERPDYQPAFDYYKKLRDRIIETHQKNLGKKHVLDLLRFVDDEKKIQNYEILITSYIKWLGRKRFSWFNPPSKHFSYSGVDVIINPELGLCINEQPHLIKLYFKDEPLRKNKIEIITHLMATCLSSESPQNTQMSILDIRNENLISPTVPIDGIDAMIKAELAYIAVLWGQI